MVNLNNGLILQYGKTIESVSATDYKYFPISYTTTYSINVSYALILGQPPYVTWVSTTDLTKFVCGVGSGYGGGGTVSWISVGY